MNLASGLRVNARGRPDHPALLAGDLCWTHAELASEVGRMARRLERRGLGRGDVVGVALRDSALHLVLNYATAWIGAILLPLDWRWTPAETARVATHFRAALVVGEDEAPPPEGAAFLPLAELLADAPQGEPPALIEAPDLPLLISLSSGTTGSPKGPCLTHAQMLRRFWTHWINLGLNANDRYVSATPLYFGGGRTFAMSVLFAGGTVILFPPPFDAQDLCGALQDAAATSTFLVPTQLRSLLALPDEALEPLRSLKLLISSGAPLDPDERCQIDARLNANFCEYYASTEGGGISLSTPMTRRTSPDSVGRPVFGVETEVVGDDDRPLQPGTIGRFRYRGPGVATGYAGEVDAETAGFKDGWFYPGDLAEIDRRGFITLRGRSRDMILRGGVNIYPPEVETALRAHPSVSDAAVVGRPSQRLGQEVAAFCVAASSDEVPDEAQLATWCRERLAPYKVPKSFHWIPSLPRNSAGKVLKAELATRLSET